MARYKIITARCGETEEGFGCEMDMHAAIAEVHLRDDQGKDFYMSAAYLADIPDFYKTDVTTYELQIKADATEAERAMLGNLLQDGYMDFGEFADIYEQKDPEWYDVQRYLIYLIEVCDEPFEVKRFIKATVGKYMDEIDIPVSSFEEDYSEE